jgi:hypothetical protein
VRYLPLILSLLAACAAPPTQEQVTSRAVQRNCEAQGAAAANAVRQQSVQVIKEGSATDLNRNTDIEAKASDAQRKTFKSCMLKYAV